MSALGSGQACSPRLSLPTAHFGRIRCIQVHRCILAFSPPGMVWVAPVGTLSGQAYLAVKGHSFTGCYSAGPIRSSRVRGEGGGGLGLGPATPTSTIHRSLTPSTERTTAGSEFRLLGRGSPSFGGWGSERGGPAPLCDIPSGCCSFTGPWTSPVLPFACCVGALLSVDRCGRCSRWCRFRVRGAQRLVCRGCVGCGGMCRLRVSGAQ